MLSRSLQTMRVRANLSQRDVANHMGYATPQFISNWERGVSCPPVESVKKLASLYKVDAEGLFNEILQSHIEMETTKLRAKFRRARV